MCIVISNSFPDNKCYIKITINNRNFLLGTKNFKLKISKPQKNIQLFPFHYTCQYKYKFEKNDIGIEFSCNENIQEIIINPVIGIADNTNKGNIKSIKLISNIIKCPKLGMHINPLQILSKDNMLCEIIPSIIPPPKKIIPKEYDAKFMYPIYSVPTLFSFTDVQMVGSNGEVCVRKFTIPHSRYIKNYIIYQKSNKKLNKKNNWHIKLRGLHYFIYLTEVNRKEKLNKRDYFRSIDRLISILKSFIN